MAGRSRIRTANESLQEQFLARIRAVAADPSLALPEAVGTEPAPLVRLRRTLGRADGNGPLPLAARFDRGILGALRLVRTLARQETAPRLLDAKVDGRRRFYLQRGHLPNLVNLGIQNWDDPAALMLAYGPLAVRHGLTLYAGRKLWCAPPGGKPPVEWLEDLGEAAGIRLTPDEAGAACPHGDRVALTLTLAGGTRLRVCGPCDATAQSLHARMLQRMLHGPAALRPAQVGAAGPDGAAIPVAANLAAAYAKGQMAGTTVLDQSLKAWRSGGDSAGAPVFVLGGRAFPDQESFLDHLGVAGWERVATQAMTAGGHRGDDAGLADVLAAHRGELPAGIAALLPDAGPFAPGAGDVHGILRLAHEEAERRERLRDLPHPQGLGPVGERLDRFVRDLRRLDRASLLQATRRDLAAQKPPGSAPHLFAFLRAAHLADPGERSLEADQRAAGEAWAPLAAGVLGARGPEYPEALRDYLAQTGAGEAA